MLLLLDTAALVPYNQSTRALLGLIWAWGSLWWVNAGFGGLELHFVSSCARAESSQSSGTNDPDPETSAVIALFITLLLTHALV